MWNDNEFPDDLLGFDYLAESLNVLLHRARAAAVDRRGRPRLGVRKSSLMKMAAQHQPCIAT